jgi:hypothetical protein
LLPDIGSLRDSLLLLPRSYALQFLIKNNKEYAPETSGSSLINFPYNSLLKTIRKLLPRVQDHPEKPDLFIILKVT